MAIVDGHIRCNGCGNAKPVTAFTPSAASRGSGTCRACKQDAKRDYERRNRDKANAAQRARRGRKIEHARALQRAWYRRNRESHRGYSLAGRYGITSAQYDALLAAQGGGCACCGAKANRTGKRLFVDHDHVTGAVRGVLCHKCNAGIGALGDDLAGLRRAVAYLERVERLVAPERAPTMRINLLHGAN